MTPEDVAAIRERGAVVARISDVLDLCDALESAWEQRDEWKASHIHWRTEFKAMRERAERAELLVRKRESELDYWRECAERDEWKNELAGSEGLRNGNLQEREYWRERAERAEAEHLNQVRLNLKMDAALARVRALCEELHDTDEIVTEAYDRLRAAIEGDNQ